MDYYSNSGGPNYSNYGGSNLGYGEPSGAQRGLKVLAILCTIIGALMLLALLLIWSYARDEAAFGGSLTTYLVQELGARGIVISESELTSLLFVIAAKAVLISVAVLLTGIFGIRAANDPERVTPYLVTSGILLAYTIFDVLGRHRTNQASGWFGSASHAHGAQGPGNARRRPAAPMCERHGRI